jgi:hypothetical protein
MFLFVWLGGMQLSACDELIHLWQPLGEVATDGPMIPDLTGGIFLEKLRARFPDLKEKTCLSINSPEQEQIVTDLLLGTAPASASDLLFEKSNVAKFFPKMQVIIPSVRSNLKILADMVCYFGITVRAFFYNEYLLRYCLQDKNREPISVDELQLKSGLAIDWIYTGNFLCGGLAIHRVSIFDGSTENNYTMWSKSDLDKLNSVDNNDESSIKQQ